MFKLRKVPVRELPEDEVCRPPSLEDDDEPEQKLQSTKNSKQSADQEEGRRIINSSVPDTEVEDVLPKIRELVMKDRDILEKGTKAYTS